MVTLVIVFGSFGFCDLLKFIFLFLAVLGLLCCAWVFSSFGRRGLRSSCCVGTSHCGGFSCRAQAPGHVGFSGCGSWA